MPKITPHIKVYHGYGYAGKMVVFGHVFKKPPRVLRESGTSLWANLRQLLRLFAVETLSDQLLELTFDGEQFSGRSRDDGFFRFEWAPGHRPAPGWHTVEIGVKASDGLVLASGTGRVLVLPPSPYVFISDVDDTVVKSYSATLFRRVFELLSRNTRQRKIFDQVNGFYDLLAGMDRHTAPSPFFYVSSSEWNLYDYLQAIFRYNRLPEGIFLLNPLKRLRSLLQTGKKGHEAKRKRIGRILETLPDSRCVLIGDNSQKDPVLYAAIARKYPGRVFAVFIRNVRRSRKAATAQLLGGLKEKGIHVHQFDHSREAMGFARDIFQ